MFCHNVAIISFRYVIKSGDIHSLTIKKVGLADDKAVVKVTFGEASSKAELRVVGKNCVIKFSKWGSNISSLGCARLDLFWLRPWIRGVARGSRGQLPLKDFTLPLEQFQLNVIFTKLHATYACSVRNYVTLPPKIYFTPQMMSLERHFDATNILSLPIACEISF